MALVSTFLSASQETTNVFSSLFNGIFGIYSPPAHSTISEIEKKIYYCYDDKWGAVRVFYEGHKNMLKSPSWLEFYK